MYKKERIISCRINTYQKRKVKKISDCKFYAPNGKDIITKDDFIKIYNKEYFLNCKNKELPYLNRCSCYVEKEIEAILENGIHSFEEFARVLAWKIGKIKHHTSDETNEIKYSSDWKDVEDNGKAKLYGKDLDIKKIYNCFENARNDFENPIKFLDSFDFKYIGPVYLLTLLYFASKGIYPIYDRFAHIALIKITKNDDFNSLIDQKELDKEFQKNKEIKTWFEDYENNYIGKIQKVFGDQYKENRDIDRALWTYGHLFNKNKTNEKRINKK